MFRFIIFGLFAFASAFTSGVALALDELHIKAGKPFVVNKSMAQLKLKRLIIDDKAIIQLVPDLGLWMVDADDAQIGFGVQVKGAGRVGSKGISGGTVPDATRCDVARNGRTGGAGANGGNGVDVRWSVGISQFGSIIFDLSGGAGGDGGDGGDGQNQPNLKGCKVPGGDAGDGGKGGDGGDGGSIRFHYWVNSTEVGELNNAMQVKINGGRPGEGGDAGFPGVGAEGRFETGKTLTGNRVWVAGGGDGEEGGKGATGSLGRNGGMDIRRINKEGAVPIAVEEPTELSEQEEKSLQQRIEELEILTQKLDARIRLLELDKQ